MCLKGENKNSNIDSLLEALADERRRVLIQYLRDSSDGTASYDDLVDHVRKCCTDVGEPEQERIRLHHMSLPKLEKACVIEIDSRSEMVRYDGNEVVDGLIEFIENRN